LYIYNPSKNNKNIKAMYLCASGLLSKVSLPNSPKIRYAIRAPGIKTVRPTNMKKNKFFMTSINKYQISIIGGRFSLTVNHRKLHSN
tara:strand:- start:317 stop:577 length:261 start_codon:yes stop_codon:yes gene_type:complete